MEQQYSNEITPATRQYFSQLPYSEELLSLCDNSTRKELEELNRQKMSRPLACISRIATAGNLTNNGDAIRRA
ncbi:hypothetical protein MML63_06945 [Kosakonia sacchari]|uniref:hypothetical protein n=1 Tax=Kosakonia sacchari TaxID=1158459 RepID=UPI0025B0D239|nr:hypothetical protein [Kosakonia sacchari]MDN2485366.1 hypothetical protein [Kosakonia sacchari]